MIKIELNREMLRAKAPEAIEQIPKRIQGKENI